MQNKEHTFEQGAHSPFKDEAQTALFKNPVRTAQKTLPISVIKTNQFMIYGEEVALCSEINTVWAEYVILEC